MLLHRPGSDLVPDLGFFYDQMLCSSHEIQKGIAGFRLAMPFDFRDIFQNPILRQCCLCIDVDSLV